jgi:hypothetical protein
MTTLDSRAMLTGALLLCAALTGVLTGALLLGLLVTGGLLSFDAFASGPLRGVHAALPFLTLTGAAAFAYLGVR